MSEPSSLWSGGRRGSCAGGYGPLQSAQNFPSCISVLRWGTMRKAEVRISKPDRVRGGAQKLFCALSSDESSTSHKMGPCATQHHSSTLPTRPVPKGEHALHIPPSVPLPATNGGALPSSLYSPQGKNCPPCGSHYTDTGSPYYRSKPQSWAGIWTTIES